jgi:hypothetical protein
MAKCTSPARMGARNLCFCSSVPYCMIVGPTEWSVSVGIGAPAVAASSKKISCSSIDRFWPPYSVGQPMPSQPSLPICRTVSR